jgi:hypothetical protein
MHRYFVANVGCVTLMTAAMYALTGEWESACFASNDYVACIYGQPPVGEPVSVLVSTAGVDLAPISFAPHRPWDRTEEGYSLVTCGSTRISFRAGRAAFCNDECGLRTLQPPSVGPRDPRIVAGMADGTPGNSHHSA